MAALTIAMTRIVLLPSYNMSHLIPHPLIRNLGLPYSFQLWIDHNVDKVVHGLGAFILVTLLFGSHFFFNHRPNARLTLSCLLVIPPIFLAEYAQKQIGRGFSQADIIAGLIGVVMAALLIRYTVIGRLMSHQYTLEKGN